LTRCQGNLLNRHSHKYSGLANSKVVNIYATPEGSIAITKVKKDATPNQVGLRVTQYRTTNR
jgi:large subunit ribosomal protein L28e